PGLFNKNKDFFSTKFDEEPFIVSNNTEFTRGLRTTSVFTSIQNVGTKVNCCISSFCIYVLYRFLSAVLRNIRYQIQCIE
ncbi:MAG: hypothetical protein WCR86_13785, partial [Parabacteroides sp.]